MRFASTFTRGAALVAALVLPSALTGVIPAAARAAGASAHGAAAHGAGAGTGENTPLSLAPSTVHHVSSSGGSGILRTIIALVIVIAVIYAVARILKAVKGRDQRAKGDGLAHLATLPLGPNKSVALVRSGADIVLVGIAESGVTPIKTYTEQEAIESGLLTPEGEGELDGRRDVSFEGFLSTLRRMTVRA
jgi:flagellar protein FliO/FliZ